MAAPEQNPNKSKTRPLDITIFGILFIISAPMELASILSTNWAYLPKFFGFTSTGLLAKAILLAQPILHLVIGYGFLTLRRWTVYVALFYAADTLTSSVSSFILHGYGLVRTVFILLLTPFVVYLVARRRLFTR